MVNEKLLILDLDETLIHASENMLERSADFEVGRFYVYKRPHVDQFLKTCLSWFDVAVWTSSSPVYARGVVRNLFPDPSLLAFVWASNRCSRIYDVETCEHYWRKNLKKVQRKGYTKGSIIAVDDTPQKWEQSYGNLIRVSPFEGDPTDKELVLLLTYLDYLRHESNIRRIEKRDWRRYQSEKSVG